MSAKLVQLKGAGRVEIAENLLPFYQDAAKGRQKDHGGTAPKKSLPVKLPEVKNSDARGDMATLKKGNSPVPQKVAEPKNSEAREAAGKAAGVKGEPHRPKKESGYNVTSNEEEIGYNITRLRVTTGTGKAYTSIPLSSVRSMPPTRYRSTSRNGDGIGMGLVIPRNKTRCLFGGFSKVLVPRSTRPDDTYF